MHWNRTNRINSLLFFFLLTLFHYLNRLLLCLKHTLHHLSTGKEEKLATCKASMRVSMQQLLNRSPRRYFTAHRWSSVFGLVCVYTDPKRFLNRLLVTVVLVCTG